MLFSVLCPGIVVAKSPRSCENNNIQDEWNAECGNVAFMPCDHRANLRVGTRFEICVAGIFVPEKLRLVYDNKLGYEINIYIAS